MEEVEDGIRIKHEGPDGTQVVQATFDKETSRLTLLVGDQEVTLGFGETGYFLAQMAGWYDLGGD